jgi:hypothetical protein
VHKKASSDACHCQLKRLQGGCSGDGETNRATISLGPNASTISHGQRGYQRGLVQPESRSATAITRVARIGRADVCPMRAVLTGAATRAREEDILAAISGDAEGHKARLGGKVS